VQRGRGRRRITDDIELAEGRGGEVGAGLVALRAVVGQSVDIMLAGLDDRCAGVETGYAAQESIREVLDHGGNARPSVVDNVRVTVTVMPMAASHKDFVQAATLFDEYRSHYGQVPSPGATRSWLHEQLTQQHMSLAVAVDDPDEICGFITTTVLPASLTLGTAWSIRDLYVAPRYRRGGLASRLLEYVVTNARAAGARRVSLQTETDNAAALALYIAAGFQPVDGLTLLNLTLVPESTT
jgi:ribosomal protein S18 acetylase RimI-like enzyme